LDGAVDSVGGVLVDKKARVLGQWASFPDLSSKDVERSLFVIPSEIILEAIDTYQSGGKIQTLGVEFEEMNLIQAREYGLNPLQLDGAVPKKFYTVSRIAADVPATKELELGDIILSVNGSTIHSIREMEKQYRQGGVSMKILRQTEIIEKNVGTVSLSGEALDSLLFWNGAVIHDVPWAVSYQKSSSKTGAYISWCGRGAPCASDGLSPTRRIIRVDETEIKDTKHLIEVIRALPKKDSIRVELVSLNGEPSTIAVRPDELYWQTRLLKRDGSEWSFEAISGKE
jgi:S1-C subfamily serine protease